MIELAVAVAILAAGVWLYRRRSKGDGPKGDGADGYGSQGAVILFVIALIIAIHALGGLDYHPSASELQLMRAQ
jgi:hypothetical protein